MRKGNPQKRVTRKDRFAAKYFCKHVRLGIIRSERKLNRKRFRKWLEKMEDEEREGYV